jgi:hypothetical protein
MALFDPELRKTIQNPELSFPQSLIGNDDTLANWSSMPRGPHLLCVGPEDMEN